VQPESLKLRVPELAVKGRVVGHQRQIAYKFETSRITRAADGAARTIALEMPVRFWMWDGMETPAFIRLW
jgi:hypothetical protein